MSSSDALNTKPTSGHNSDSFDENYSLGDDSPRSPVNSNINTTENSVNNEAAMIAASTIESFIETSPSPEQETQVAADHLCRGTPGCVAKSEDHRKVVSHFFGRNKKCTRQLPDESWVKYCRKHYQRLRYRSGNDHMWHENQLTLVRQQLDDFERLANVDCWHIVLQKAKQDAINKENAKALTYKAPKKIGGTNSSASTKSDASTKSLAASDSSHTTPTSSTTEEPTSSSSESAPDTNYDMVLGAHSVERSLLHRLGDNKSYDDVREVLDDIERIFASDSFRKRQTKDKVFPAIEFLPRVSKKTTKKAAAKPSTGKTKAKPKAVHPAPDPREVAEPAPAPTTCANKASSRKRKAEEPDTSESEGDEFEKVIPFERPAKRIHSARSPKQHFTDLYH